MKLRVSKRLLCGHSIVEMKEYFWNTTKQEDNEIEMAKYESYINFNKPGLELYCQVCNDMQKIKDINVHVESFDARTEVV